MLAEIMVATFRKGNEGCLTCGDKNHLKRDFPKKAKKKKRKKITTAPKVCPHAVEKCIVPKSVNLNLILKENLFQKTPSTRPPCPLQQKPGANSIFSLKPSTSGSAAVDTPALNDFLLYPQAIPSRIPTGLFGSLPPTNLWSFTWPI